MNLEKIISYKHTIAGCIGLLTFVFVGALYTQWWFSGDNFQDLYHSAKEISKSYFPDGNPNKYTYTDTNSRVVPRFTFFNVLYRPFFVDLNVVKLMLFNDNAYAWLLFNALCHALNTVLLYYLLLFFLGIFFAMLGALFFAFHPQIGWVFDGISTDQYYVNVLFFLCILFLMKRYLDYGSKTSLFASWFLFGCSIFTRETGLVLLFIIPISMYVYLIDVQKKHISIRDFARRYYHSFVGFFVVVLTYISFRAYHFPCTLHGIDNGSVVAFGSILKDIPYRLYEFLIFLQDFFWISWLPYGHSFLRIIITGFLLISVGWLWLKSQHKISLLWLPITTVLLLWHCIVVPYSARYVYEITPCIILFFAGLFASNKKMFSCFARRIGGGIGVGYVILLMIICYTNMRYREKMLNTLGCAVKEFVARDDIHGRALCMLTYPSDGFRTCITPALRFFTNHLDRPILCDYSTRLLQYNHTVVSGDYWLHYGSYVDKNYYTVSRQKNCVRFTSQDLSQTYFNVNNHDGLLGQVSLGHITIHKQENASVADFTLTIDKRWMDLDPLFFVWDYKHGRFCLLEDGKSFPETTQCR